MERVPDYEAKDCIMKDDDSVELIMEPDLDVSEHYPSQKFEAFREGTSPANFSAHQAAGVCQESDKNSNNQDKNEGEAAEELFIFLQAKYKEKQRKEKGDDEATACENTGNQLASPVRDVSQWVEEKKGYEEDIRCLQEHTSTQNVLSERILFLEAQDAGLQSGSPGRDGSQWVEGKKSCKEYIHSLEERIHDMNSKNSLLSERIQFLETQNAGLLPGSPRPDDTWFMTEKRRDNECINALREHNIAQYSHLVEMHQNIKTLEAQNAKFRNKNMDLTRRLQIADRPAALANGTKVSDGELKSQWKELKFSVQNLALLIAEHTPEARYPTPGKRLKGLSGGNISKASRRMFNDPDLRRWAIEQLLWLTIWRIVFESRSRSDLNEAVEFFKLFKMEMLKSEYFPPLPPFS